MSEKPSNLSTDFEQQATEKSRGLAAEFWDFLRHNKKWWLTPIIVAILLVGVLVAILKIQAIAPFIYPLF